MKGRLALVLLCALLATVASGAGAEWGGEGCADEGSLRTAVDDALVLAPLGDGRGSSAPGLSVALEHDACGVFAYATGRRRVEGGKPNQVATRQHIGSMTKPVTTALTLILAEQGLLGDRGIDAKVAPFFTRAERQALTKGVDPGAELCPATVQVVDRSSGALVELRARCPKLKKITIRQLLSGNHGMWDFVNEVDRNRNGFADIVDYVLGDLLEAMGVDRLPPADPADGFEVLTTTGILQAKGAKRGRRRLVDFEASFGNTGYQLLGLILERVSGRSFEQLVDEHIVEPLGLSPMLLVTEVPRSLRRLASEYAVSTGAETQLDGVGEDLLGIYPLVDINGHPAVDVFDMGPVAFTNGGGAAGALSATPEGYVQFFHALVTGGLLSDENQAQLEEAFLAIEGVGFEHGFALFRVAEGGAGTLINKGGQTAGSNCYAIHSVDDEGGNGVTAVVCRNSADLFLPDPESGGPGTSVDLDELAIDLIQLARP